MLTITNSKRFIHELAKFKEVNLFFDNMPLVDSSIPTTYKRHERGLLVRATIHFLKMLGLAMGGITSLSIKPIRFIITSLGVMT